MPVAAAYRALLDCGPAARQDAKRMRTCLTSTWLWKLTHDPYERTETCTAEP